LFSETGIPAVSARCHNSDAVAGWTSADVSIPDPQIGVSVRYGVKREDDPGRFDRQKAELARDTSAYALAGAFGVQSVIAPNQTPARSASYLKAAIDLVSARGAGSGR
jgi:hypothetical protein